MNNTKTIEKIIKSKEAPKNTNVIWLDLNETEDINNPSLKVFNDGKWIHITADMEELINTLDIVLQDKADLVGGKVPASQLPSYVDDVIEFYEFYDNHSGALAGEYGEIYFMNKSIPGKEQLLNKFVICVKNTVPPVPFTYDFAFEPERGKLYLSKYTNKLYRWTGSVLLDITQKGLQLGTTSTEAFPADIGYLHDKGRFCSERVQISNGKGSSVLIGSTTTEPVHINNNVTIGNQLSSTHADPVVIRGNVNIAPCNIGNSNVLSTSYINIGTDCTNKYTTLEIKGNTRIDSRVNIKNAVYIGSNTTIGSKVYIDDTVYISSNTNIGTGNALILIGNTGGKAQNINIQGKVNIGTTMSKEEINLRGKVDIGNGEDPVSIGGYRMDTYDRKSTSIGSGVYIGFYAFVGHNVKIGQFDSGPDYYGSSNIQIGTTNNSNINIQGINVLIGKNKDSEVVIGLDSTDNPSSPTNGVYIGNRVVILDDFDSRNIVLGTNSKSKIKINNIDGELSFGTNGDNYAVTFGSNSITFTNKNTNLSTSLTLS